jgi:hypothetical protein
MWNELNDLLIAKAANMQNTANLCEQVRELEPFRSHQPKHKQFVLIYHSHITIFTPKWIIKISREMREPRFQWIYRKVGGEREVKMRKTRSNTLAQSMFIHKPNRFDDLKWIQFDDERWAINFDFFSFSLNQKRRHDHQRLRSNSSVNLEAI